MLEKPSLQFSSFHFDAPVWNMIPVSGRSLLIIENRNEQTRAVSFSALDYQTNSFLWKDVSLPEKWWITLAVVEGDEVILKIFDNSDNPDMTSYVRISLWSAQYVSSDPPMENPDNEAVIRPHQYLDGEEDFEVVKKFLKLKLEVNAMLGAEYLATADYIFISYYKGSPASFVNCFSVFNLEGKCLFSEEIGTKLKGIGWNTFFLVSGRIFFVKNKTELVTFRIV